MRTQDVKTRTLCSVLAICLSAAPAVFGQMPQTQPHTDDANVGAFAWQTPQTQNAFPQSVSRNVAPETLEQQAKSQRQGMLDRAATVSLHAGRYAEAEAEARQALSLGLDSGAAYGVLGAALTARGKNQEALQMYHAMIDGHNGPVGQTRYLLPYALLLLKSGQWEQAVAVYDAALPDVPDVGLHSEMPVVHDEDLMRANSHFSPDMPEPAALATAIHLARGLVYNASSDWAGEPQNTEALVEYGKALQLAPDSPLANYYYGVGWQKLSHAEQAKFGSEQQAKAALRKAVLLGKGGVKKAAQKALLVAMKTKAKTKG